MVAAGSKFLDNCNARKYKMNVVLLEDNNYEWSRPFVENAVEKAIEKDRQENLNHGTHIIPQRNCFLLASNMWAQKQD